ncbi:uncharacterized protein LOC117642259 [Thrips palmi]|uniref:Uncharacterized protein LOC117642259 n=1 Tax=Thrips palmi TaxID=161013 RepID=A0A6P8Y912_THRPL|nr:uncharacterized protein LOC117642259 [Thrips palmi]
MTTSANEELGRFLTSCGLPHLLDKCKDLKFTLEGLKYVEKSDLSSITPYPGEVAILWGKLTEQKQMAPVPKRTHNVVDSESSNTNASSSKRSKTHHSLSQEAGPSCAEPGSAAAGTKLNALANSKFVEDFDLLAALNGDSVGREIVKAYQAAQTLGEDDDEEQPVFLTESQRNKIVEIIIEHVQVHTEKVPYNLLQNLAVKIVELFPTECEKTYYVGPKQEHSSKTGSEGKLSHRLKNCRNKPKIAKPSSTTKAGARNSFSSFLNQTITSEITEAQAWLSTGRTPWPEVLRKWALTAPLRFQQLFNQDSSYVNSYLEEWEVLKHKSGFELLLQDFALIYPNCQDNLHVRWDVFEKRTFNIAAKDVRDSAGKEYLKLLSDDLTKDSRASILLALLPSIRASHRALIGGKAVKFSVVEVRSSYLLHVKVPGDLKRALDAFRLSYAEEGGGRPIVIVVGPALTNITTAYMSVANLLFKLRSVVEALDVCFKVFHALHCSYPPQCSHIWMMLQKVIYNINTEWDQKQDVKHSWINSYSF